MEILVDTNDTRRLDTMTCDYHNIDFHLADRTRGFSVSQSVRPNLPIVTLLIFLFGISFEPLALAQCQPGACAQLTVKMIVDPSSTPGLFDVKVDGSIIARDAGDGTATNPQSLRPGWHVIGQVAGAKTALTQYVTTISGDCAIDGSIELRTGDNKTCTIANRQGAQSILPADVVNGSVAAKINGAGGVSKDGSATYSIPLWVPPGRAGIQPGLSLSYNSQNGNGLVGVGWSLAGFPQITRCRRTISQDGKAQGISYADGDEGDRYCFDGQRLVKVGGPAGARSTYGGDGTEYRTENDIHANFVSHSPDAFGPTYFQVYLKDGRILTLGGSTDSVVEGQRVKITETDDTSTDPQSGRVRITPIYSQDYTQHVRYSWSLSRMEDRSHNYLTVHYGQLTDNYSYEIWPTGIDYTGWAGNPAATPKRHVEFDYEARPDVQESYVSGLKFVRNRRLKGVRMWYDTTTTKLYVRQYVLTYTMKDSVSTEAF